MITIFNMGLGHPEVVLHDPYQLLNASNLSSDLKAILKLMGDSTGDSTNRVNRYGDYIVAGTYGPLTNEKLLDFLKKFIPGSPITRDADEAVHTALKGKVAVMAVNGGWHGGATTDSQMIDPGIKPLVDTLVSLGADTFSSCEGHGVREAYVLFNADYAITEKIGTIIRESLIKLPSLSHVTFYWGVGTWERNPGIYFEIRLGSASAEEILELCKIMKEVAP